MSEINVWNVAAVHLGWRTLASTSDATDEAKLMSTIWPIYRGSFLEDHHWKEAMVIGKKLARFAWTPAEKWSYAYALPPDYLKVVSLNGTPESPGRDRWAIGADPTYPYSVLFADESEAVIDYVFDLQNIGRLPKKVVLAMGVGFAAVLAHRSNKTASQIKALEQRAEEEIAQAKAVDSQQGTLPSFSHDHLITARRRKGFRR